MFVGTNLLHVSWQKTFERACYARQVDPVELVFSLGIEPRRFFRQLKQARGPALDDLERICDYFEITIDSFLTGFIDTAWISRPTLPEKYSFSAGSRLRTSLPVLEYAKKYGGEKLYRSALRTLKIPETLLNQPDHLVSIRLLSDILSFLASRGLGQGHFIEMGWQTAAISQNAEIGKEFLGLSEREVFEKLFDETILRYEMNFDYQIIQSSNRSVKVRVAPKALRLNDFGTRQIDNSFVSLYRHGACAAHLKHAGYPVAKSKLTASAHQGAPFEEFALSW